MNLKRYDLTTTSNLNEFYLDFESRRSGIKKDVTGPVTEILQQVKLHGDTALYRYTLMPSRGKKGKPCFPPSYN